MNVASTVEGKEVFEQLSHSYNVAIKYYHCDNELCDSKLFKLSIQKTSQSVTFCGVNDHHQNGQVERRIKDVTEGAQTSLLIASHRWPKVIHPSL